MRLTAATLYALQIPFVESFRHSATERSWCDSVVIRVQADTGAEGFGEGIPRTYVTGETADLMLDNVAHNLWPRVAERELPDLRRTADLPAIDALIPEPGIPGLLTDNASRAALELAIVDCILRGRGSSASEILPPRRQKVVYSGVITAGSLEKALQHARQMKLIGLRQVKLKVGFGDDVARVRVIREALGPDVSLRVDANGGWTVERAAEVLDAIARFDVAAVEQPVARGSIADLKRLREVSPIPLMVDESLVTLADAEALIAGRAADYFNVRVSKCGGLARSVEIARRAAAAGIRIQVGSHVGETAILSAAGRHLAAFLEDVTFVEGSYGSLLLTEDVGTEGVRFGYRGEAPVLGGLGLGICVREDRLRKYARAVVHLTTTGELR